MTLMDNEKEFPDWDTFYKENEVEKMPWYEKGLDPDIEFEIKSRELSKGNFLDLGTGPGTQAIQLAKIGFKVTGTDLSHSAIQKAQKLSDKVNFLQDDILATNLEREVFEFILDRGCFHVFEPSLREKYLNQVLKILKKDGILFLKCISNKENDLPKDKGPYKLSKEEINDFFSKYFEIEDIRESVYHGTLNPLPQALFAVMRKR